MPAARSTTFSILACDRWDTALYAEVRAQMPGLTGAEEAMARHLQTPDCSTEVVHDVFVWLWSASPRLLDYESLSAPEHRQHWQLIAGLSETPGVDKLHRLTQHDDYAAGVATVRLVEQMRRIVRQESPGQNSGRQEEQPDAPAVEPDDTDGLVVQQLIETDLDAPSPAPVAHALRTVVEHVTEMLAGRARMATALGIDASALQRMDMRRRAELMNRLDNAALRSFLDLVGRFRAAAAGQVALHGDAREQLVGLEASDRIADMVGAEHALRIHRLTRLEHLSRLADASLQTWRYEGTAPQNAGPMVVAVDESQSTEDVGAGGVPRWVWIKAFTLAMLEVARLRGRDAHVISFSGPLEVERFDFPAGARHPETVLAYAEHMWSSGTAYEAPLDMARQIIAEKPSADVIVVTDESAGTVRPDWIREWSTFRARTGVRCWGVAVDASVAPVLHEVCDTVRVITDLRTVGPVEQVLAM